MLSILLDISWLLTVFCEQLFTGAQLVARQFFNLCLFVFLFCFFDFILLVRMLAFNLCGQGVFEFVICQSV